MSNIEWGYLRKNCTSCDRAKAFFAEHEIAIANQVDARSIPLVESDALRLIAQVNELYVTRGTKVVYIDLKEDQPGDESLLQMLIGRSGKLRAPALKYGQTLVVGFDQTTYDRVFR